MINEKIDKYIYKAIKYIVPLVFILPFIVSDNYYFPYITPRNFLFRIIVSVLLGLYLYLYFRNKGKYGFNKNNKLIVSYLIFALVLTISSIINGDFLYSFWSNYERMDGLITIYYLIAFLIVLVGIYRKKKAWIELIKISVWSSFIMSIIALSQHWGINLFIESSGGERITGTSGNATYLAVYSLFNLFFGLYLLFKYKNIKPRLELWLFYVLDIFLLGAEIFGSGKGFLAGIFSDFRLIIIFLAPQIFINIQYYFYNVARTVKYSWTFYLVLLLLLNFISLFNTQTRGVLLGLFVAALVVATFLLFSKYVNRKIKLIVSAGLLLVVLFTTSIFTFKDSDFIQSNNTLRRVSKISISDDTTETRLLTWQLSLKGFQEKPVVGWGVENFYIVFNKYFPNQIYKGSSSRVWFDRPHNVFLQQLVEGGALGLIAYLAIFFFALSNLWKHYRKTKDPVTISILSGLLIAYLVQNFFVFDSVNSYTLVIIFLAISILISQKYETTVEVKRNDSLAISSLVLVLILGVYLNIPKMVNNADFIAKYQELRTNISMGEYNEEEVTDFISVIERQYLGKYELRQVYAELVPNIIQAKIFTPTQTRYFVDTSEEEMLKSIEEQPTNVRHHSFLLNLYFHASLLDKVYSQKGVDLIEDKALDLSPTRIQLYYFLGQFYIHLGNDELAKENFIKAKELAPNVFESYYNLILLSLTQKDIDSADAYLEDMKSNVDNIRDEEYNRLYIIYDYFGYKDKANNLR